MSGEKIKKFLISAQSETKLQDDLTKLHLFVCAQKKGEKVDFSEIDKNINKASVLWLKNNKIMLELISPIKAELLEMELRFQARSDMLLGIEGYLKNIKRGNKSK